MSTNAMTERQARDWPRAVDEVQQYVDTSTVPLSLDQWLVTWEEETRPGRGHSMNAIWCNGEYLAQVLMDVYGAPAVSISELSVLHSSADDECTCVPCTTQHEQDAADAGPRATEEP